MPGSQLSRQDAIFSMRASRLAAVATSIGAWGKPEVWSITCSMVMASLPLGANSSKTSTTFHAGSIFPSPMRIHIAPATNALVAENTW